MQVLETSLGDTWGGVLALFLLFALFFAATLGYGSLLRRRLPGGALDRLSDSFLLGSLALFVSAFALSALHLLSAFPGWIWALMFLPGLAAFVPLARKTLPALRSPAVALFLLVFLVRALSASQPARHGDPLLYHLLGPRLWVEGGGFLMHPNLPNALLASTWECLYVWPQLFWISRVPFYGLVEAQLFSQWLHLFLAWGGCALLVMRLFRGTVRQTWLPLAGLAALFVAGVQWTAPLAKNDAGIAFWVLGAVVYFAEGFPEKNLRKVCFSGVFVGLAVAGKITALLSLGPLLGLLFLSNFRFVSVRSIAAWAAGFLCEALPLYFRNWRLSGNPFFPLFPNLFPSPWMSKSWEAHFAQVHPSSPLHSLSRVFTRFPELVKESPWILGSVILLVLATSRFSRAALGGLCSWPKLALLAGSLAAYAIFTVTQAPEIELRYLGASLMVLAAGGVCGFLGLAEKLPSKKLRLSAGFALLAGMLALSKLPLHILRRIWKEPLGVAYVRTHTGGEAKAWVREHSNGGFVVVAGDNETYYLTPVGVAVLTERPDFDSVNEQKDYPSFLKELCRLSHAKYLLDVRPRDVNGLEHRFGTALTSAKVFEAQGANVYELGCEQ